MKRVCLLRESTPYPGLAPAYRKGWYCMGSCCSVGRAQTSPRAGTSLKLREVG